MKRLALTMILAMGCAPTWSRTVTYSDHGARKSEKSEGRCSELPPVAGRIDVECTETRTGGGDRSALRIIGAVLLVPLMLVSFRGPA